MGLYWPLSQKQNFRAFLVARISTRSVLDTRSKLLDARNKISRDARLGWMLDCPRQSVLDARKITT